MINLWDAFLRFCYSTIEIGDNMNWMLSLGFKGYVLGDPFAAGIYIMLFFSFVCWILSIITRNYSQVDRIWSIVPFVYCWHFFIHHYMVFGRVSPRLLVMALLTTVWGLRLSYNFYRKGGYSMKEEDYRWPVLRKIINNQFLFELFNISFIALYQNMLLYMITLPMFYAYLTPEQWTITDTIATASFLFFLVLETIADQQQWNYQTTKYSLINAKKPLFGPYAVGFLHSGLFQYSRHPNFFAEMSIWWCFYVFSTNYGGLINQTIIGTILLTLLFQGSTKFTESITEKKYPVYLDYKKYTSRFIPLPSPQWTPKKSQ